MSNWAENDPIMKKYKDAPEKMAGYLHRESLKKKEIKLYYFVFKGIYLFIFSVYYIFNTYNTLLTG